MFFPEITQKDNFENFEKFPWTYLWLCRFLVNLQAYNLGLYWEKDFFTNVFRVFPRNFHDASNLRTVKIYDDAFFTRRLYFHYKTGFRHTVIFFSKFGKNILNKIFYDKTTIPLKVFSVFLYIQKPKNLKKNLLRLVLSFIECHKIFKIEKHVDWSFVYFICNHRNYYLWILLNYLLKYSLRTTPL